MTLTNSAGELYYVESGKFGILRLILALLLGAVLITGVSAVYAYADLYNPSVKLAIFIPLGFGWLVGVAAGRSMRLGHVRNSNVRIIGATLLSLIALYASWSFWLYALARRDFSAEDMVDLTPLSIALQPAQMWSAIQTVSERGAWTIGGKGSEPVTGFVLWLFWLAETGIIVGLCIAVARWVGGTYPYCESCGRWVLKRKQLFTTRITNVDELRSQFEAKDFAPMISRSPAPAADPAWYEIWANTCESCQAFNTISVEVITHSADKRGRKQKSKRIAIKHLLLSTVDFQALQAMRERQKNPSASVPSPAFQDIADDENDTESDSKPSV